MSNNNQVLSKEEQRMKEIEEKERRKQEELERKRNKQGGVHDQLIHNNEKELQYVQDENGNLMVKVNSIEMKFPDPEATIKFGTNMREVLIGCHFEPEVARVFRDDMKNKPRGWQSHLVNELVKEYYKTKNKM